MFSPDRRSGAAGLADTLRPAQHAVEDRGFALERRLARTSLPRRPAAVRQLRRWPPFMRLRSADCSSCLGLHDEQPVRADDERRATSDETSGQLDRHV